MKSAITLLIPIVALATFVAAAPEAAPVPAPLPEHQLVRRAKIKSHSSGSGGGEEEEEGDEEEEEDDDAANSSAIATRPWLVGAGVAAVAVGGMVELW